METDISKFGTTSFFMTSSFAQTPKLPHLQKLLLYTLQSMTLYLSFFFDSIFTDPDFDSIFATLLGVFAGN